MSTFDETTVRRGQPGNAGQFAEKHGEAPTSTLAAPAPADGPIRIADAVTDADRRAARARVQAVADALRSLQEYPAPALGVVYGEDAHEYDDPAQAGFEFVCPWCGKTSTQISANDYSERSTTSEGWLGEEGVVEFDYDGSEDYHGTHYSTQCCPNMPVSLPDGWEER